MDRRLFAFVALAAAGCGRTVGDVLDSIDGGDGEVSPATGDAGLSAISLAASDNATCATLADGTLWCWGQNTDGALVAGGAANVSPPARIGAESDWVEVSGAHGHCALTTGHAMLCWGPDDAVPGAASAPSPTPVEPSIVWGHAVAGARHHCALAADRSLYCWGANDHGQLGVGDTTARTSAARLAGTWNAASVGLTHTCALGIDGSLWCWGHGQQGQLGLGDEVDRSAPAQIGTSTSWRAVSAGGNHTCALDGAGALWCWGENAYGEVGTGDATLQTAPVHVGTGAFRAVASGAGLTCAIAIDGTLWCWGDFGQATQPGQSRVPAQVDASTDWTRIAAGFSHACGVRAQGGVYCLGWNFDGQLGAAPSATYSAASVPIVF